MASVSDGMFYHSMLWECARQMWFKTSILNCINLGLFTRWSLESGCKNLNPHKIKISVKSICAVFRNWLLNKECFYLLAGRKRTVKTLAFVQYLIHSLTPKPLSVDKPDLKTLASKLCLSMRFPVASYRRLEKPCMRPVCIVTGVNGRVKETVHPRCSHWLAINATFTTKIVVWPPAQASGDGRRRPLATLRKQ